MKTVSGILTGVDRSLAATGRDEPIELGRVDADVCVRHLLGLPGRESAEEDDCAPSLSLRGRRGMWLTLIRKDPGRILRLTMKDGEQDHRIDEIQATGRVRLFVEHWGEETELTEEIRLPPEVREMIAARERSIDEARRIRTADGPPRIVFRRRRGLLLRKHEFVVDRENGVVTQRTGSSGEPVGALSAIRSADVRGLAGDGPWLEIVLETEGGEERRRIGEGVWDPADLIRMAEAVNDSIDLPESRRKVLRYRRFAGRSR